MADVQDIYYNLPKSRRRKIAVLAEIVSIPRTRFKNVSDEDAIRALAGLILYRHLSRNQEREVNQHCSTLPRQLRMSLRKKRANILINPAWGMWSLSNEELIARNELTQKVSDWAKVLGLGEITVGTIGKLISKAKTGNFATVSALLVSGVFLSMNYLHSQEINAEMIRRLKSEGSL